MTEELADLFFHCLVAMNRYNIALEDVAVALASRQGVSGLSEKAERILIKRENGRNKWGAFSIWHWLIVLLVVVLLFGTKNCVI